MSDLRDEAWEATWEGMSPEEQRLVLAYQVCFECEHIYDTAQHLQDAYVREASRIDPAVAKVAPPADRIDFCPMCLHNF